MAWKDECCRKCFTFIWKLENASYCWQKIGERIESPSFILDSIEETKWKLRLYPRGQDWSNEIGFYLVREADSKGADNIEIEYDLSFLAQDGTSLESRSPMIRNFFRKYGFGFNSFATREDVFGARRSAFLRDDTLTARCRIWKTNGEIPKEVQCFARTRIGVEKTSFLYSIKNFSSIQSVDKYVYRIKSLKNNAYLICMTLILPGGLNSEETISFDITPRDPNIKLTTFQLSALDASRNATECFRDEFWFDERIGTKRFALLRTKRMLMEEKNVYLPGDVLTLQCECAISFGIALQEIERISYDNAPVQHREPDSYCLETANLLFESKSVLNENLKSMLDDCTLFDINLRTTNRTYPAHKCILSARSPVFKAMFSNNMKEKISEYVDIEDFDDDTISLMLQYIYTAEVKELEWETALHLYQASDMYEILTLRNVCSFYLKVNLCPSNACETLVLANLHEDDDLKSYVQDFILRDTENIMNSEEWEHLMKFNPNVCSFYLKANLCPHNACETLVLADMHKDDNLKSYVQDYILRDTESIVNSEEWKNLMKFNPNLAMDTLKLKITEQIRL
ncbi:TD and POZ domain-containing protein 3 [Araneus ventricosus]|uniref:TD and POZ domain-containing protein 3 n=1 Tax=Araneus ventricosus TaxID=182803 RepID=A0A4Y2T2W4_ARAVE|nr:TD and POZ domain-containing protein 3 [Araneus ventricosus]